MQDETMMQMCI